MTTPNTPRRRKGRRIVSVSTLPNAQTYSESVREWKTLRDAEASRHTLQHEHVLLVKYADGTARYIYVVDLARYRYRAPVAAAPRGFV